MLLVVVIGLNIKLVAMEKTHELLDDAELLVKDDLKIIIDGEKIDIPYSIIKKYPGSLFDDLINNHPKKTKKTIFSMAPIGNRIEIKHSKAEFELAYIFITKQRLPVGYFENTAHNAAANFKLEAMNKYIDNNPPQLSGHYTANPHQNCPHCNRQLDYCSEIVKHMRIWHRAQNITVHGTFFVMYQIPTEEI
jgi:hypothetical protein